MAEPDPYFAVLREEADPASAEPADRPPFETVMRRARRMVRRRWALVLLLAVCAAVVALAWIAPDQP